MELAINVYRIEPGRFPKVWITDSKYLGCSQEIVSRLKVGEDYRVALLEKTINKKDGSGTFKAREIIGVLEEPVKSNPSPAPVNLSKSYIGVPNGSKYSDEDKKGFKENNDGKGRGCALNNAALLTESYAKACIAVDAFKGLNEGEIRNWLRSFKASEYADNLKRLGIEQTNEDAEF